MVDLTTAEAALEYCNWNYSRLLRAELHSLRRRAALKVDAASLDRPTIESHRTCARCLCELGRIINRGAPCRSCRLRVCKACREFTNRTTDWVCLVCHKQMWVSFPLSIFICCIYVPTTTQDRPAASFHVFILCPITIQLLVKYTFQLTLSVSFPCLPSAHFFIFPSWSVRQNKDLKMYCCLP